MKTPYTVILGLLLFASNVNLYAQNKYFVKFNDKAGNPYSTDTPSDFLSERAISRRAKQNISITADDLPVTPSYVQQVSATGATIDYTLRWFNGVVITTTNSSQLASIQGLPFVNSVKKIYESATKGSLLQVDAGKLRPFKKQASADVLNYGSSSTQIKMMNGHILHNNGYLGSGIHIAVLDAGFLNVDTHSNFDSLRVRGRIIGTKDFVNPTSDIYSEHYHGMMVLSTMGGYTNGQLIGTAPHAKYWLIRTENADVEQIFEEYTWAAGAEFADSVGVDIINTSLGYTEFDVTSQNHTYADLNGSTTPITQAANYAAARGIAIVVSAGNDGDDSWHYISAPADSPNVLTVGAVDSNRTKASFSSFGPTYDGRTKPDVCAMGENSVVASTNGAIGTSSGTSFSSPIMAGLLACLWNAKPNLTSSELIQLVKTNASQYQSPNNSLGYGIPDFATATGVVSPNNGNTKIGLHPNPFSQSTIVTLPAPISGYVNYSIFSILGKEVLAMKKEVEGNSFEIAIPQQLPKGSYLVKVFVNSTIFIGKGIKN